MSHTKNKKYNYPLTNFVKYLLTNHLSISICGVLFMYMILTAHHGADIEFADLDLSRYDEDGVCELTEFGALLNSEGLTPEILENTIFPIIYRHLDLGREDLPDVPLETTYFNVHFRLEDRVFHYWGDSAFGSYRLTLHGHEDTENITFTNFGEFYVHLKSYLDNSADMIDLRFWHNTPRDREWYEPTFYLRVEDIGNPIARLSTDNRYDSQDRIYRNSDFRCERY